MAASDIQTVLLALAAFIFLAAILVHHLPVDRCPHPCGYCRDLEHKADEERKRLAGEATHDAIHRGYGISRRPIDVWDCADPSCPRNKANRT